MAHVMKSNPFPQFTVGDRLRKAREHPAADREGWDAKSFAALIGISRESLRKYEAADVPPRRPVLLAWAMATGFTVEQLTGDDGPNEPISAITLRYRADRMADVVAFPLAS